MGVGALAPSAFLAEKGYFLSFEWRKNFTTFAPPGKILENLLVTPLLEKSFRLAILLHLQCYTLAIFTATCCT